MNAIALSSRRRRIERPLCLFNLAAIAAMLGSGCSNPDQKEGSAPPQSAEVSQQVAAEAKVEAINPEKRVITLRREDGTIVVVQAGPEVRNFAQIKVGDTVTARYMESLAVSLKKPEEAIVPASATIVAGRAAPGEQPAAGVGSQLSVTVTIDSIDLAKNKVGFTLPAGEKRVANVQRPEGREFIKGLKPGDRVEITYTEAIAISVETK